MNPKITKSRTILKARWINTNPIPNHASGSGSVNALEVEHPRSPKVLMNKIYQMMVNTGYGGGSIKYCRHHDEEGHLINQCKASAASWCRWWTNDYFKLKKATGEEVPMMESPSKYVCQVQFITNRPPKLILSKPTMAHKEDYSALPHNYGYSFQNTQQPHVFQEKVRGLIRSGRCFTP